MKHFIVAAALWLSMTACVSDSTRKLENDEIARSAIRHDCVDQKGKIVQCPEERLLRGSKRQYCCVIKLEAEYSDDVQYKCREKTYARDEIGRLLAGNWCNGLVIDRTPAPIGWFLPKENKLHATECNEQQRCPYIPPECLEGEATPFKKVYCEVGYYETRHICEKGKWVRQDLDAGCRKSGESIK